MLAILCATSLGLAWTIDKFVSGSVEASTYSLVIWTLPILYIYLPSLSTASIHLELKQGSWKIPLVACMNVAGYYLKLRALSLADASRVIPIATSHVVLVVFGGIIFLKETTNIRKKLIAGAMVFAGIMLLR